MLIKEFIKNFMALELDVFINRNGKHDNKKEGI